MARRHQRHRHGRRRSEAVARRGQPHRWHGLLGLQHLPQDFDRCNLRVHRPRRGGPDRGHRQLHLHRHWCGDARRRARFVNDGPDGHEPRHRLREWHHRLGPRERPQRPDRRVDRHRDRLGPRVRRGQRSHELQPGRRHHRRALGNRKPQHAGRAPQRRRQRLRRRRVTSAPAVRAEFRRHDGRISAALPEQHLLQRFELAR